MIPTMVSLNDCPIGVQIHKPHSWRGGLFWGTTYGCDGVDEERYAQFQIMKAGSKGTLTNEQVKEYLEKWG
jgi:hypothetical protein